MATVLVLTRAEYSQLRDRLAIRLPGGAALPPAHSDIEEAMNATVLVEGD